MKLQHIIFSLAFVIAGCGALAIKVEEPRTFPANAGENAAVYFVLENGTLSDDMLLGADSPVAESIEIHRSALIEKEDQEAVEEHGGEYNYFNNEELEAEEEGVAAQEVQLEMPKLDSVWIAAGHEIEFEPKYFHLMLIGLKLDLTAGDQFPLTLHFENYGDLPVVVVVEAR
jgi:copper(I)-binding protein